MSSPFQQKFMAKNPVKGFTLDQLKKASDKAEKQMKKSAAILPQVEGPGNPDYESTDPQKFAGDDTYTYGKKDDSPLNAYVSTAASTSKMLSDLTAGAKQAVAAVKEDKEAEFKGETKKVSKKLKETTDKEFKGFKDGEYEIKNPFLTGKNHFNKFGQ